MSSKKLVTPVTAFRTHDGGIYGTYDEAVQAAASAAIEAASLDENGDHINDGDATVYEHSGYIAQFLLRNKPLIRQILGL